MMEYRQIKELSKLEPHYCKHVSAMTVEGLHSKSDIACELAWRDQQIEFLRAELEAVKKERDELVKALLLAVRQNDCDMLMTGEELRLCRAALAKVGAEKDAK